MGGKVIMTPGEETRLLELKAAGYSIREIARRMPFTFGAIQRFLVKHKPTEPPGAALPTPLRLVGDAVVVGDVHVPACDWEWSHLVARIGERHKIPRLIIGGDLFSMDVFSTFKKTSRTTAWATERDYAKQLLSDWLETFQEIVILLGNHDRRLIAWTDGEFGETDIIGMITSSTKVITSPYSWLELKSGEQLWRITHPKNYGINQLAVAADLAAKHQANICSFHEHHLSKGYSRFGHYIIINGGCLVDPERLEYVQIMDSRAAAMQRGFVEIKNGVGEVYGPTPFTDWNAILA